MARLTMSNLQIKKIMNPSPPSLTHTMDFVDGNNIYPVVQMEGKLIEKFRVFLVQNVKTSAKLFKMKKLDVWDQVEALKKLGWKD